MSATSKEESSEKGVKPEKQETSYVEVLDLSNQKQLVGDSKGKAIEELSAEERTRAERRLLWKLDIRFLPTIILIYIMNYIDRNAITTARLKGLEQDLGLTDDQYNFVVAILFTSYCTAQIPSNMLLNRLTKPSMYIAVCVIAWGITSALSGVTHNYAGILVCRVFIGFPECAFYPGTIYLLSRWYTRKELSFRTSILFAGLLCSNAFGSLMAAGILSNMEGKMGIRGWRWLFYIEGSITVTVGLLSLWSLPDLPHNTRWLTPTERLLAQARMSEDAGEADQDVSGESVWLGLKLALTDYKVYIFSLMNTAQLVGLSFAYFFPTLTATLGYNTTVTLLIAAPPWIFAALLCSLNALHADRTGERFLHIIWPWWGTVIGYIIAICTFSTAGRYFSLFLLANGHAGFALTLAWTANTIPRPPAKRAASIAIVNAIGNCGNIIGTFVWRAEWGPSYHNSMYIGLACLVFSSFLAFVMRCILVQMNKKLDRDELGALKGANLARIEESARIEGITIEEALERKKGFRYLY